MRPIYLLLKISLNYAFRLFYKRFVIVDKPSALFSSTIYVSNHPNSFMDPLVVGGLNKPVVHFMTRSDVFKWWLKPILWSAQMLPIYRQLDGENTKDKNAGTFDKCTESLRKGRNILIFGEGFTDDTPLRGLKPVKKGALRIGFNALESINWSKKIYIGILGINYSDRNTIGSEIVLFNHKQKICLNDYRTQFEQNPNKTINDLTKVVETRMQESVIYIAHHKEWQGTVETIMQLTRKGFNNEQHDDSIPLLKRWEYARRLAQWANEHAEKNEEAILNLKAELDSYAALLKRAKLTDRMVYLKEDPARLTIVQDALTFVLLLPFALIGLIHGLIPYLGAKMITERLFKRHVFWGSVKMMLGKLFGTIYNLPILIYLHHHCFQNNAWMTWGYFFVIPILCFAAYKWTKLFQLIQLKRKLKTADLTKFVIKRKELVTKVNTLVVIPE